MRPILVTGASGTVGREVVRLLSEAGAEVRAGAHRPRSDAPWPPSVREVVIDFESPATIAEACDGAGSIYLLTPQVPSATEYVESVLEAARAAGVERIVRHSMHDAPHGLDALSRWHREAEDAVLSSGFSSTILRPNAFMQNFATIYAPGIRDEGSFRLPLGQARLSSVDTRDVAACAAAVLLGSGHGGAAYTLTGPQSLSGEEMATTLSMVTGRPVRYLDEAEDADDPPRDREAIALSEALVELSAEMRTGKLGAVSDDAERLLGRPPGTFLQFARDYRQTWV